MSGAKGTVRKYFDIVGAIASTVVYSGGATGYATGIADPNSNASGWLTSLSQATTDTGRLGQSIAVETLDFRMQISWDLTSASGVTQSLRVILFADNECDGSYPAVADYLANSTVATGAVMSFLQPAYFGRFNIIEDRVYYNTQNGGIKDGASSHSSWHESHHDLRSHRVMWDTTDASAIANARKGHIFVTFIYEQRTIAAGGIITISTATPPGVQYTSRIRFRDV